MVTKILLNPLQEVCLALHWHDPVQRPVPSGFLKQQSGLRTHHPPLAWQQCVACDVTDLSSLGLQIAATSDFPARPPCCSSSISLARVSQPLYLKESPRAQSLGLSLSSLHPLSLSDAWHPHSADSHVQSLA